MKSLLTLTNKRTCPRYFIQIACLSVILVLEGCFSYSTISKAGEKLTLPDPGDDIRIERTGGDDIELEGYHYVAVRESSDFVYGLGRFLSKDSEEAGTFAGKLTPVSVDSSHTEMPGFGMRTAKIRHYDFRTAGGSRVRFNKGDFVRVPSGTAP